MIFAGLVGAILWNLMTWLFGLPSSSSHALFGGLIGAVLIGAGVVRGELLGDRVQDPAAGVMAPLVAGLAAGLATFLLYKMIKRADDEPAGRLVPARPVGVRRRWSRWPTAPPTGRRRWASSPWC